MFDEGYTPDGAAQALGWSRAKVTARAKILKLPEVGQRLVGTGAIPLSAIDNLLAIATVSPAITQALVDAVAADKFAGAQIAGNPGWAIGQALRHAGAAAFGAYLNQVHPGDLPALRLGKRTEALVAKAEQLHKQLDRYAYGPPQIRFADTEVDRARAAGVLIEIERSAPIICDRGLYRELCKQAIARTVDELAAKVAAEGTGARDASAKPERTPREELDVEHRANLRELSRQAHGVNLDLGAALLNDLAIVAPDDIDVARFFALCGRPHRTNYADESAMPRSVRRSRATGAVGGASRGGEALAGRHSQPRLSR